MGSGLINFSSSHDVGIITLNRPEARNALSTEMFNDLAEAIRSCRSPDVRAVLITGSGEAFCAGADVRQFDNRLEDGGPQGISSHLREAADGFHKHVILEIRRLEKPVVAGVNGVAAGGGFSWMLSCDLRVASESARLLMAYAGIGAAAAERYDGARRTVVRRARRHFTIFSRQPKSVWLPSCSIGME